MDMKRHPIGFGEQIFGMPGADQLRPQRQYFRFSDRLRARSGPL